MNNQGAGRCNAKHCPGRGLDSHANAFDASPSHPHRTEDFRSSQNSLGFQPRMKECTKKRRLDCLASCRHMHPIKTPPAAICGVEVDRIVHRFIWWSMRVSTPRLGSVRTLLPINGFHRSRPVPSGCPSSLSNNITYRRGSTPSST